PPTRRETRRGRLDGRLLFELRDRPQPEHAMALLEDRTEEGRTVPVEVLRPLNRGRRGATERSERGGSQAHVALLARNPRRKTPSDHRGKRCDISRADPSKKLEPAFVEEPNR